MHLFFTQLISFFLSAFRRFIELGCALLSAHDFVHLNKMRQFLEANHSSIIYVLLFRCLNYSELFYFSTRWTFEFYESNMQYISRKVMTPAHLLSCSIHFLPFDINSTSYHDVLTSLHAVHDFNAALYCTAWTLNTEWAWVQGPGFCCQPRINHGERMAHLNKKCFWMNCFSFSGFHGMCTLFREHRCVNMYNSMENYIRSFY